jgi:hypothetical protein
MSAGSTAKTRSHVSQTTAFLMVYTIHQHGDDWGMVYEILSTTEKTY